MEEKVSDFLPICFTFLPLRQPSKKTLTYYSVPLHLCDLHYFFNHQGLKEMLLDLSHPCMPAWHPLGDFSSFNAF